MSKPSLNQKLRRQAGLFGRLFNEGSIACLSYRFESGLPVEFSTRAVKEILNVTAHQLEGEGRPLLDYIHPEDKAKYYEVLADYQLLETDGHLQRPEFRVMSSNHEVKWIKEEAYIEFDEHNKIKTVAVAWQETTDSHKVLASQLDAEKKLSVLLDSLNLGFFEMNLQTKDVYFSGAWKKQIGYEDYEIENKLEEWESRIPEVYKNITYQNLDAHLRGDKEWFEAIFPMRHKNDHQVWILAKGKAEFENGIATRIIGTHTDLSSISNLSDQVDISTERHLPKEDTFEQIFASTTIGMALFELSGELLKINDTMVHFLGYEIDEIAGRPYISFLHPDDQKASYENVQKMVAGEQEIASAVRRAFHKDGHIVYLKMDTIVIEMQSGKKLLLTSGIDVSEEMEAQNKIDNLEQEIHG